LEYHFRVIERLKGHLQAKPVDVLYHRHSIFSFASVALGSMLRIPVVLEVNYSEVWARKNWSRLFFEKLAIMFERIAFQHADIIVVVSDRVKEDIMHLGAPAERILVNPNAADVDVFHPDVACKKVRKTILSGTKSAVVGGFIGTFTRWHGVETLMEAIKLVHKKKPELHFLLIGDGNLKHALEIEAQSHGLQKRITFTGLIPHSKAPMYLAACDFLISPHLGFEDGTRFFGSPTKLFEYMAMGKAIIASDLEQIGEIIRHNKNGLLMKPGDAPGLAKLILRLSTDKKLRLRLGTQARADVVAHHTWKINAQRVLDALYKLS
jgi:glycosyltransferase involved in cell wall biosynthesis